MFLVKSRVDTFYKSAGSAHILAIMKFWKIGWAGRRGPKTCFLGGSKFRDFLKNTRKHGRVWYWLAKLFHMSCSMTRFFILIEYLLWDGMGVRGAGPPFRHFHFLPHCEKMESKFKKVAATKFEHCNCAHFLKKLSRLDKKWKIVRGECYFFGGVNDFYFYIFFKFCFLNSNGEFFKWWISIWLLLMKNRHVEGRILM